MFDIKCDLCGGNIAIADGGIAKCQNCGMEYTHERLKEKMQDISHTTPKPKNQECENNFEDVTTQKRIMKKYIDFQTFELNSSLRSAFIEGNIPLLITTMIIGLPIGGYFAFSVDSDPILRTFGIVLLLASILSIIMFFVRLNGPKKTHKKMKERNPQGGVFRKKDLNIEFSRKEDLLNTDIEALNRGEYYVRCKYCEHKIPIISDEGSFNCPQCGKINRY